MLLTSFFRGFSYAFSGIAYYITHPRLWKYAIFPTLLVLILYSALAYVLFGHALPALEESISHWSFPSWLQWLSPTVTFCVWWGSFLAFIFFLAVFLGTLFELFGGPFFACLVRRYEHIVYGRPLDPGITFRQDIKNTLSCVLFSCSTLALFLVFYVLGFFFPFVAQILLIIFIGYRYSLSYCSEAAFNRGWSLGAIKPQLRKNTITLYGFGIAIFLLLLIPFISFIFIPGLYLGGTRLINEESRH